jgi:predicted RNase H-like nuclease (RuvC/YqgF family)
VYLFDIGMGSPSSKPPTQNGNNEDQDLNQMIEQLQTQLGGKKRRIREKEELMERELQQQRQYNNRFQEELNKREVTIWFLGNFQFSTKIVRL